MSQSTVARRYSQALFQLALEKKVVQEVNEDLQELVKVVEGNPEFITLLTAPKFSIERKKKMVGEIFANAQPIVKNTLEILIDKKRMNEVIAIAESYKVLAAESQGAAEATVYSTRELTEEEKAEISASFSKLVGKERLEIKNIIDPSLLGGARIQIGNYIFDNTVVSKLDSLKRTLVG